MPQQTSIFQNHQKLNARFVDFGGWEMPIQYEGIQKEHLACRSHCGLFDVGHMGEFEVSGLDAREFLNYALTQDLTILIPGRAAYTVMCKPDGGIVDDLVIYCLEQDKFLIVVNASNIQKDLAHLRSIEKQFKNVSLIDKSSSYSLIAIQGRFAEKILKKITVELSSASSLSEIKFYYFNKGLLNARDETIPAIISRTGYTGEDGFELYVPWKSGPFVWDALMEAGKEFNIQPCGLGARDTLRLEMKYPLYGQELSETTSPLEAGLSWVTKLSKKNFIGKDALLKQNERGVSRKLIGFKLLDKGVPRPHYKIFSDEKQIGEVTSGTFSPSLNYPIGIGYVEEKYSKIGTKILISQRERLLPAEVVKTPFYTRDY